MLEPDRIETMARELQTAVIRYYESEGFDLPSRRFLVTSSAQEVHDCGQFTVACDRTAPSAGLVDAVTDELAKLGDAGRALRAGTFVLTIARCGAEADDNGQTDDDEESEVAAEVWRDGVLMQNAILTAQRDGVLPSCGRIRFGEWTTTPQPSVFEWSSLTVYVGLLRG